MAGEEFIVPYLRSRFETFEALRISELADQFILVQVADAGFERFNAWMMPA